MAIALRGSPSHDSNGTPLVLTKPVGTVSGDVLFCHVFSFGVITLPSGFTVIGSGTDGASENYVYAYKVAGGSEPATYSFSSTANPHVVSLWAMSGVDNTTPVEAYSSINRNNTATPAAPAATPTVNNVWMVSLFYDSQQANTVSAGPSGMTQLDFQHPGAIAQTAYYVSLGTVAGNPQGPNTLTWGTAGAYGEAASYIVRPSGSVVVPPKGYKNWVLARLGGFSAPVATRTLSLTWALPTILADGTAVGTITSQKIYYDTVSRSPGTSYSSSVSIVDGVSTSYVLGGLLPSTTYYIAISSTTAAGESSLSQEYSGTTTA